jgi:hypothetical protein
MKVTADAYSFDCLSVAGAWLYPHDSTGQGVSYATRGFSAPGAPGAYDADFRMGSIGLYTIPSWHWLYAYMAATYGAGVYPYLGVMTLNHPTMNHYHIPYSVCAGNGCQGWTCAGNQCWDGCAWQWGAYWGNNACAASTCYNAQCWNGCWNIWGTYPGNGCQNNICQGYTCNDGCDANRGGAKICPPLINTFTASRSQICNRAYNFVQNSVLSWTTTSTPPNGPNDTITCSIDQGIGNVPVNGSITVSPTVTTTYTLTCWNKVWSATSRQVTITVFPPNLSNHNCQSLSVNCAGKCRETVSQTALCTVRATCPADGSVRDPETAATSICEAAGAHCTTNSQYCEEGCDADWEEVSP